MKQGNSQRQMEQPVLSTLTEQSSKIIGTVKKNTCLQDPYSVSFALVGTEYKAIAFLDLGKGDKMCFPWPN